MGTSDRIASIIQRIAALDRRMEEHLLDPLIDGETRTRMARLHAQWREQLAANVAAMESLSRILRRIDGDKLASLDDSVPPGDET